MPEVICDTSPIQYLHQIGLLHVLEKLAQNIIVPPAVVEELEIGRNIGINLPDVKSLRWIEVRPPISIDALSLVKDLGPGETQALALALETDDSIVVIDDNLAREIASSLSIKFMGTLGVLLDAKKKGLISTVEPVISQLQTLKFRLSKETRHAVLQLAGELD